MTNRLAPSTLTQVYAHRFAGSGRERQVLWSTLVEEVFQRYVAPDATVVDLAAGHCEFINRIGAGRRIAIDVNPDVARHAAPGVETVVAASTELPATLTGAADVVFVSNFFEHLDSKHQLLATLDEIRRVLRPDGHLLVLQPNLRLVGAAYWDFVDHSLPITDRSLGEALRLSGFRVVAQRVRFLPYTLSGRLPVRRQLIRWYLRLPPAQWLFGKQTFVVARRT